ncbi:MAG: helix-turn-helix domain-containing protein [Acidimicrobiia bacterium]|nr:helix-turn-helix domain-containing protein [Acidimicrobiia bacterium]
MSTPAADIIGEALRPYTGRSTITIVEAGQILGIGRSAAYAAANRGQIPTIVIGRKHLVPLGALAELLAGRTP